MASLRRHNLPDICRAGWLGFTSNDVRATDDADRTASIVDDCKGAELPVTQNRRRVNDSGVFGNGDRVRCHEFFGGLRFESQRVHIAPSAIDASNQRQVHTSVELISEDQLLPGCAVGKEPADAGLDSRRFACTGAGD